MDNILEEYMFNGIQVIEIRECMCVSRFKKEKEHISYDNISFNTLWNNEKQCINKGFLFIFFYGEFLYNIFISDDLYKIDERLKENGETLEKIIFITPKKANYTYVSMKHDEIGSTVSTRCFSNGKSDEIGSSIPVVEVYEEVFEIIQRLETVEGIENAIDLVEFYSIVMEDLGRKLGTITL